MLFQQNCLINVRSQLVLAGTVIREGKLELLGGGDSPLVKFMPQLNPLLKFGYESRKKSSDSVLLIVRVLVVIFSSGVWT